MKKKKRILIVALILVVAAIGILSNPKVRTNLFVRLYHEQIEEGLRVNAGVPADDVVIFGYESVNTWEGEHSMTEFLIGSFGFGSGSTYYGCYYSPDDVPLAFHNTDVELTQDGHEYWEWQADGDNHGSTSKIMDYWYYFEAEF